MAKKVIVITGTSRGLGFALAELYLEQGATVIGVARNSPSIESDEYFHLTKSITDDEFPLTLETFLRKLRIQKIDILIKNAGADDSGVHLSTLDPSQVLNLIVEPYITRRPK
jgi:3-oxoacyl-[acyl-carrier protein] reductase